MNNNEMIEKNQNNKIIKTQNLNIIYRNGKFFDHSYYNKKIILQNLIPIYIKGHQLTLGKGAFSEVYVAKDKITNEFYAIKKMEKFFLLKTINTLETVYNEIEIQSRIIHPNIIRLYNTYENNSQIYLIMEYIKGGNLYSLIKRKNGLTEKESYKYFYQILKAVYFLHKNNIIHRDIKPENILLDLEGNCKLCDFGWSVLTNENSLRKTFCGTVEYMAPEIINNEKYDKSIDIWALGVLLFELIHGFSPFVFNNNYNQFNIHDVFNNIKNHSFTFKKNISPECKDLIQKMLEFNSKDRISIEDIFQHDFIKLYSKECNIDIDVGFSQDIYFDNMKEEEKFQIPHISPIINTFKSKIDKDNNNDNNIKLINSNCSRNADSLHYKSQSENFGEGKGEIIKNFSRKKIRDFTRELIDDEIEKVKDNKKEERLNNRIKRIHQSSTNLNNSFIQPINNNPPIKRTNTKIILKFTMNIPISRQNSLSSLNSKKENINLNNNNNIINHQKNKSVNIFNSEIKNTNKKHKNSINKIPYPLNFNKIKNNN